MGKRSLKGSVNDRRKDGYWRERGDEKTKKLISRIVHAVRKATGRYDRLIHRAFRGLTGRQNMGVAKPGWRWGPVKRLTGLPRNHQNQAGGPGAYTMSRLRRVWSRSAPLPYIRTYTPNNRRPASTQTNIS